MKLLYVTKQLPFGVDEAFIYAEVRDHLENGCDVTIVPVNKGPLIHDSGRALLDRTIATDLLDWNVVAGFLAEFLCHPIAVIRCLASTIEPLRARLIPRNLAVWAKGVWLAREVRARGIEHIHVHWIAVPATMGLIASRLSKVTMSITAHRYDIAQGNLISAKFDGATFVRAIDGPGANELSAFLRNDQKRPTLIRMGVEIPKQSVSLRGGSLPRLSAIIGARLVAKKGHETLLNAVALARKQGVDVAIDVYGDGPLQSRLTSQVHNLRISDLISFKGPISHPQLLQRLASGDYDLGVLPSITTEDGDKEGVPVFLMEAMGVALPVVSTPNGGISELIQGGTGILVPERDAAALAEAFVRLAGDGELRLRLGLAGRRRVEEEFSITATARHLRERFVVACGGNG